MPSFFEYYFPEADFSSSETQVLCPFPHKTVNGIEYDESNPSAGVNLDKGVFHCFSCGAKASEASFIKDILGCTYEVAIKIAAMFHESIEDIYNWEQAVCLPEGIRQKANQLGISDEVINELHINSNDNESISFPVTLYDKILDIRNYNPGTKPKVRSRAGATMGLIIPFDIWKETPKTRWTLVCAGEKDMAIARSHGFNAITITGGEMMLPILLNEFKERNVAICYDNDTAGINGARKLASVLKPLTENVRVITGFHEVCKEKGEDITDFFMKYGRTAEALKEYIKTTPNFSDEEAMEEIEKVYPTMSLLEASKPAFVNKMVRTNIQVVATFESSFIIPTTIVAEKLAGDNDKNPTMKIYEKRTWNLTESSLKDILHLLDNNFTEDMIIGNIKSLLKIPKKEKYVKISKLTKETIFKSSVTDLFEASTKNTTSMEYTAYSIGKKLESGKKYKAKHQLVPHPYKGQQLTMLILDVDTAADTVTSFKVDNETIPNLQTIQQLPGSVEDKVKNISNRVKGIIGFDADDTLIQAIDLSFHTVLNFNFAKFKEVRGYLDTLVVSESRVGKSSISEALQKTYNLGVFASLAGNSATMSGLVGGSNKVNGSFQTRAGLIPQNHQGLLIFEELAKCNANILRELTDIKSSNEVRITRVNGTLNLPALVRMITLTNVRAINGISRAISNYPNGLEVITELVGTAEDIARFDIMLVLANPGNREMDFFWEPDTPFSEAVYQTRIRWIWSRTTEQVKISREVIQYIVSQCNELNKDYDSHIKIFGTEAWKKISRLAIAVAGYTVSTDETYENIIVTKECVDFAVKFYRGIYDNDTFKLKQYVDRERAFTQIDEAGVERLQELYISNTALMDQLEQASICSRNELMAATGLSQDDFNKTINNMVKGMFVRFQGQSIIPTERFRKGMARIDKENIRHSKIGEL